MRRCLVSAVLLLAMALVASAPAAAQSDGMLPIDDDRHAFLVRQQTLGNLPRAFLSEQPLSGRRAARYLDSLAARAEREPERFSGRDRADLARYRGERPAPGAVWMRDRVGGLYGNGEDFFAVADGPFRLQVNPGLYLSAGAAREGAVAGESARGLLYRNTRALRVSGSLHERLFFHAQLEENQWAEPMLARERSRRRLPLAFQSDSSLFDYMVSRAHVGYRDRHLEVSLGVDQVRWGPAAGSLYLSNHSPPHAFVQTRLTAWRLSYTAHYAVLDDASTPPEHHFAPRPAKYAGFHRLAIDLPGRVQLGLFDSIVLAPERETLATYLTFLNPLVFFNAVDRSANSPGNVLLGMDAHWIATRGVALYGQVILDDFEASKLFGEPGYWKNTWGVLGGVHLVDPLISGLDVRAEAGRVRPYVFSNLSGSLAHTHRKGYLGSPMGPNSESLTLNVRYRPLDRLRLEGHALQGVRGRSMNGLNYGDDPLVPYHENRVSDDEVTTLQGIRQRWTFLEGRVGYELLPSLHVDGVLRREGLTDGELGRHGYTAAFLQLRWGFPVEHPLW